MFADFVPQWVRKALHLYCRIFTSQKTSRYVYTKPSVYILLWFLYCTDTLMCKKIPGPASGQIPFHCGQNFAVLEVFCAIYYLTNWYFRQKWKEERGFWFFFFIRSFGILRKREGGNLFLASSHTVTPFQWAASCISDGTNTARQSQLCWLQGRTATVLIKSGVRSHPSMLHTAYSPMELPSWIQSACGIALHFLGLKATIISYTTGLRPTQSKDSF